MTKKFKVGDKVTVRKKTAPYYSGYGINPVVWIEPGDVGVVREVSMPCVGRPGTFMCVDFVKPGVFQGAPRHKNITWRAGEPAKNLIHKKG